VSLNGQPVRDVVATARPARQGRQDVALLIERDNAKIFVPVELG
jgi:hypothetical protein